MKKRVLVPILGVFLLLGLIPQLASADVSVERVAPYDYGRVCHRSAGGGSTPCTSSRTPSEKPCPGQTVPHLNCKKSDLARDGILLINSLHDADVLNQDFFWDILGGVYGPAPTTHHSALGVYVPAPTTVSALAATADIDGIETPMPASGSYRLCMLVMQWNDVVGKDCVGDYSEIRDLQVAATMHPDKLYRIVVQLYDYYGDHVAAVKVNKISYSIQ